MSSSSGDTSPDPLALPSSPLEARSSRRSPSKPLSPRRTNRASTPAKSVVLETGAASDGSPWRIRVTVEAEPKSGPASATNKVARTTKIPVRGLNSSSPPKKPGKRTPSVEHESEGRQPQRRRKGTPVRKSVQAQYTATELAPQTGNNMSALSSSSPDSRSSAIARRVDLKRMTTERSKRLSQARESLERALHDAVGHEEGSPRLLKDLPGDMTVTENEDFTMVSVESLQNFRANTGHAGLDAGEKSGVSVSYLPSSPPQPTRYPDISIQAIQVKSSPAHTYDTMSWKHTGPAKTMSSPLGEIGCQKAQQQEVSQLAGRRDSLQDDISEGRASQSQWTGHVAVVETVSGADIGADEADDIWQEEASRSLEDNQEKRDSAHDADIGPSQSTKRSLQLDDLFADQALKPRRAKIPRTWRRTSGADFAYSDSPDHGVVQAQRKSGGSTDGESRRSGVLTPPSTDDDAGAARAEVEADSSELTEPDGDATQLGTGGDESALPAQQVPISSRQRADYASRGEARSEAEETGFVWQRSPQTTVPRPQRSRPFTQRAMDLSELLNLKSSPRKESDSVRDIGKAVESSRDSSSKLLKLTAYEAGHSNMVSSPLRQAWLGSGNTAHQTHVTDSARSSSGEQPQLMHHFQDFSSAGPGSEPQDEADEIMDDESEMAESEEREEEEVSEHDETDDIVGEPSRSYEEHLNLDSPQKIHVKFNDSLGSSSLLAPKKVYPPLFGNIEASRSSTTESQQSLRNAHFSDMVSAFKQIRQIQQDVFSRLSTTFWSAVVRPSGAWKIEPEPVFDPALRTHLRSRYGVLASTHPWTMAHMRTLHRLLNSCTSGRSDSIVPKPGSGPLPGALSELVNTRVSTFAGTDEYIFTAQHAHVVDTLCQLLVPASLIKQIETGEVDFLGDGTAKQLRGTDPRGRRGQDLVWARDEFDLPRDGANIDRMFVVMALGDCVRANVALSERPEQEAHMV